MKHASETFEQFRDRVLKLLERLPLDAIDRTIESINDDRLIPLFRQKGPEPNIRTVLESKTLEIGLYIFFLHSITFKRLPKVGPSNKFELPSKII